MKNLLKKRFIKILPVFMLISLACVPLTAFPNFSLVNIVLAQPDGNASQDGSTGGAVGGRDISIGGFDSSIDGFDTTTVGIGFGTFASTVIGGLVNSNPFTGIAGFVVNESYNALVGNPIGTTIGQNITGEEPVDLGPIGAVLGGPAGIIGGAIGGVIGGVPNSAPSMSLDRTPSVPRATSYSSPVETGLWPDSYAENMARVGKDTSAVSKIYNITQSSVYTISCVGKDGTTRSVSATINVR